MNKAILSILPIAVASAASAQVPEASEDIMLQGFYWNSQTETGWTQLTEKAEEIGANFTVVWLPPSASAEGGGDVGGTNVGYHPREWTNQTSCWGTADNLKTLIESLHTNGVKVVADIVVNHRAGDTDWGNFTADDFGDYGSYQLTAEHICADDEMNTDASSGIWYGLASGAADTGENWDGARDLDHTNTYVQDDITAYLRWLKGEYGYDGWRYDYCKGYDGNYVGLFNEASEPYLSVGEYWDSSYDLVATWLEATGYQSMAFDFPCKYSAINAGLAKGDYSSMTWSENYTTPRPAGLIHHGATNRYAVTFVDNHDTYRDDSKYTGSVPQAYAFLLSSPGIPCVFWPHWFSYSNIISKMIAARRAVGLNSQSNVEVTVSSTYYEAHATGTKGSLICRIGSAAPTTTPDGYTKVCSSSGWAYYSTASSDAINALQANQQLTENTLYTLDGRIVGNTNEHVRPGLYVLVSNKTAKKIVVK